MKLFLSLIFIFSTIYAEEDFFLRKKPKPQEPAALIADQEDDDDEDEQIVLENIANMLQSIGMLSTDPSNPAVAGPAIVSFGASVINIIVQMFRNIDINRREITHEQIEQWFSNLSEKTKIELIAFMIAFAQVHQNNYALIIE